MICHLPGALPVTITLEVSILTYDSGIESRTHWFYFYFVGLGTCCGINWSWFNFNILLSWKSLTIGRGVVAQSCNPSTGEAMVGRSVWVWANLVYTVSSGPSTTLDLLSLKKKIHHHWKSGYFVTSWLFLCYCSHIAWYNVAFGYNFLKIDFKWPEISYIFPL